MTYNTALIAKHFHDVIFGGNWTSVNVRDVLCDVSWLEATTQIHSCNSIATLIFHISYYFQALIDVLSGRPLTAKDEHSFNHPAISSEQDWLLFCEEVYANAEMLTTLIRELDDAKLTQHFADEKYGSYYRNLHGLIEHTHYHLGQIVLLKKILRHEKLNS